jgi:hypothetical protein
MCLVTIVMPQVASCLVKTCAHAGDGLWRAHGLIVEHELMIDMVPFSIVCVRLPTPVVCDTASCLLSK